MRYSAARCDKLHASRPKRTRNMCASCYVQWTIHRTPAQRDKAKKRREDKRHRLCRYCHGVREHWRNRKGMCHSCYVRQWQRANVEKYRATMRKSTLKTAYGLTVLQYDNMLKNQGNACALCERTVTDIKLCVDHDHETGRVRSLLCYRCNLFLGWIEKNPTLVSLMQQYLLIHKDTVPSISKNAVVSSEMVN